MSVYFASLIPVNCHLNFAWKKLRYVFRKCDLDVAQDPPLSTYWLHINLPLYSPSAPGNVS